MVQRNSAADCLRPPLLDTLPTKCQQLKKGYGDCKRGMVDMRKRFRGNKPVGVVEQDQQSQQLYGGKSATGAEIKTEKDAYPEPKTRYE